MSVRAPAADGGELIHVIVGAAAQRSGALNGIAFARQSAFAQRPASLSFITPRAQRQPVIVLQVQLPPMYMQMAPLTVHDALFAGGVIGQSVVGFQHPQREFVHSHLRLPYVQSPGAP